MRYLSLIFILIATSYCYDEENRKLISSLQSFSSIVVSEIGDKTFFLAAIMSIKYNKIAVLLGSIMALIVITTISTMFGIVIPELLNPLYAKILVSLIFFGLATKLLYIWYTMQQEKEEFQEVEQELKTLEKKLMNLPDPESDQVNDNVSKNFIQVQFQSVVWQAFTLTLLGEWGDKSQITTISLAAIQSPIFVFLGGIIAHALCSIVAVNGGKFLATKLSEKNVNLFGGTVFFCIALMHIYDLIFS